MCRSQKLGPSLTVFTDWHKCNGGIRANLDGIWQFCGHLKFTKTPEQQKERHSLYVSSPTPVPHTLIYVSLSILMAIFQVNLGIASVY